MDKGSDKGMWDFKIQVCKLHAPVRPVRPVLSIPKSGDNFGKEKPPKLFRQGRCQ
jgi:hypothetical protein